MDKAYEILERGVANIIPDKNILLGKLRAGKKLSVYLGIDPTSTKIHLGHAVVLRKLQQFAQLGHNVTFLIGDFTALIGDTSDKETERPALTSEEVKENFKTYKKQAEKIVDFSKVKIRYNSEWLNKLGFEDILKLMQHFSAGDFVGRELIKKRLSTNKRVGLHELLYPVMQGYDSLMLDTDIQIGGTDQTFNMQAGRTLLKDLKNKETFVLSTPILEGPDGRKMSKSLGNAIWIDDTINDIFAKVMAINDDLIATYYMLLTNISLEEVEEIKKNAKKHPLSEKKELAFQIVKDLYGENAAMDSEGYFDKVVRNKDLASNVPVSEIGIGDNWTFLDAVLMFEKTKSSSEAKRLIEQGGVSLDGKKETNPKAKFNPKTGSIFKLGKRKVFKLRVA